MAEMGGRPPAGTERAPVTRGIASLTPMSGEPGDYPSHCPLRGYPEFRSNYPTLDEAEMSRHSLRYLEGSVYDSTPIPRFRSSLYSRSRATHDQTSAIYNSPYMLDSELNFEGRTDLTPSYLCDLLPSAAGLTSLNLASTLADDSVLEAIAHSPAPLADLTVSGCVHITGRGLAACVATATELETLRVASCDEVFQPPAEPGDTPRSRSGASGQEVKGGDDAAAEESKGEEGGTGPRGIELFRALARSNIPLRCLDLSFNDGLRDCHLEALSPDGTGPPLDLTRRLTQWGQSDQRGAASFEAEFAEAAKAAKAAKAAQKKQAAERKKQEAGGEGKKREDAPPPEPEVVVPPLPKLAKADLKQLQRWAIEFPWPETEEGRRSAQRMQAMGSTFQINSEPAPPCISSEALRGLEEVDLSGCRGISDASCVVLAALCPSLTTLRLCGCSQPELTSAGLAFMAMRCRGLTEVDVSGCAQLTSTAVEAITRYCSGLTRLAICNLPLVEEAPLQQLPLRCTSITALDVSSCPKITDGLVGTLASRCPRLAVLNVAACPKVTDKGVAAAVTELPSLRIVRPRSGPANPRTAGLVEGWRPPPRGERMVDFPKAQLGGPMRVMPNPGPGPPYVLKATGKPAKKGKKKK